MPARDPAAGTWSQRLETSARGRAALSVAIVVILVSVVAVNLPHSRLREVALKPAAPVLRATGLDQDWSLFAPDPRDVSLRLQARIDYGSGAPATWRMPTGGPLLGAYWDYRWRKWMEHVLDRQDGPPLRRPAAAFVARRWARPGRLPVRVTLHVLERPVPPPGAAARRPGPWRDQPFYRLGFRPAP